MGGFNETIVSNVFTQIKCIRSSTWKHLNFDSSSLQKIFICFILTQKKHDYEVNNLEHFMITLVISLNFQNM
jgi:hypothetical protein